MRFIQIIVLILLVNIMNGQTKLPELKGLDKDINKLIEQYKAVGLSVAVVKDNKIIYSKGFGYRDLEQQLLVDAQTVFPIGSVTKAFTGALLGIQEAKNQLSLKEKPSLYVPNLAFYSDEMNNLIAIEDLLSHKSGIGNQGTTERFFPSTDKLEVVQRLRFLRPEGEVKNSFEYSNMAYALAGTITEQVTGKSWETNIQENLFEPLVMPNSFTGLAEMKKTKNYALPYGLYQEKIEQVSFEKFYSVSPAGAIKSNVLDISNWMLTWLNKGKFSEQQVIPSEYVAKATRLQNIKPGVYEQDSFLYGDGFGWRLRSSYGHYRIDHGGNTYGFSSNLILFPLDGIGVIVLTNQDNSLLPYMVADNIIRRLFQLAPEPEYPVVVTDIFKPSPYNPLNKDKMPTHPLSSYTGNYTADGFGKLEVVLNDNKLVAILPTFKFQLEHVNYNTFYLKPTTDFKDVFNPQFTVKFTMNTEGKIAVLEMYSQKEPVSFTKE
ncbi:serine hydrolase [Maribacter sp. 4U21]|uniref:serine hydrolase n=1 Tax=Maribacter sp. 4U21 TaxID=1889779 RepID=UPI000C158E34|nr:serine hydrolase [Maribacter sp. 4U21]